MTATTADIVIQACSSNAHVNCFEVTLWRGGPFGTAEHFHHLLLGELEGLMDVMLDAGHEFIQARMFNPAG